MGPIDYIKLTRVGSLVGVQAFKGSFKRTCVWIDPSGTSDYTFQGQLCGGHINASTGVESSFIVASTDMPSSLAPKGYMCPLGQLCKVGRISDLARDRLIWGYRKPEILKTEFKALTIS